MGGGGGGGGEELILPASPPPKKILWNDFFPLIPPMLRHFFSRGQVYAQKCMGLLHLSVHYLQNLRALSGPLPYIF